MGGVFVTGPSPVQYNSRYSPRFTGRDPGNMPAGAAIIPVPATCPLPCSFVVNNPGAYCARLMFPPERSSCSASGNRWQARFFQTGNDCRPGDGVPYRGFDVLGVPVVRSRRLLYLMLIYNQSAYVRFERFRPRTTRI